MASNSGNSAPEVERLEPWQLSAYLRTLEQAGATHVSWNREGVPLAEAHRRAAGLSAAATVVVDGAAIYAAEPDHSADEAPPVVPIQLGPRRP